MAKNNVNVYYGQNILVAKCTFCILRMRSLNALQGGDQACISLSPLHLPYAAVWSPAIRHMLDLNRDLEICSSGWLAASKQGQVVVVVVHCVDSTPGGRVLVVVVVHNGWWQTLPIATMCCYLAT